MGNYPIREWDGLLFYKKDLYLGHEARWWFYEESKDAAPLLLEMKWGKNTAFPSMVATGKQSDCGRRQNRKAGAVTCQPGKEQRPLQPYIYIHYAVNCAKSELKPRPSSVEISWNRRDTRPTSWRQTKTAQITLLFRPNKDVAHISQRGWWWWMEAMKQQQSRI